MRAIIFACLLMFSIQSFAWTGVWNGGGGILVGGNPVTLGTAFLPKIGQNQLKTEEIPGMTLLLKTIESLNLSARSKQALLKAIRPSLDRVYSKIPDVTFDQIEPQLIQIYSDVLKIPKEQVVLLAVTSLTGEVWQSNGQNTYLLPNFFQLKTETEQAALLLHEALWVVGPSAIYTEQQYRQVIRAELMAQAYMENPSSAEAYFNFALALADVFGRDDESLRLGFSWDLKNGIIKEGKKAGALFGDDAVSRAARGIPLGSEFLGSMKSDATFSQSLFLKALREIKKPYDMHVLARSNTKGGDFIQGDYLVDTDLSVVDTYYGSFCLNLLNPIKNKTQWNSLNSFCFTFY